MSPERPALEVADILRRYGAACRTARTGHLSLGQLKVMAAIEACRTVALGGQIEGYQDCGHRRIAYNSCIMGRSGDGELTTAAIAIQQPPPPSHLTITQGF